MAIMTKLIQPVFSVGGLVTDLSSAAADLAGLSSDWAKEARNDFKKTAELREEANLAEVISDCEQRKLMAANTLAKALAKYNDKETQEAVKAIEARIAKLQGKTVEVAKTATEQAQAQQQQPAKAE